MTILYNECPLNFNPTDAGAFNPMPELMLTIDNPNASGRINVRQIAPLLLIGYTIELTDGTPLTLHRLCVEREEERSSADYISDAQRLVGMASCSSSLKYRPNTAGIGYGPKSRPHVGYDLIEFGSKIAVALERQIPVPPAVFDPQPAYMAHFKDETGRTHTVNARRAIPFLIHAAQVGFNAGKYWDPAELMFNGKPMRYIDEFRQLMPMRVAQLTADSGAGLLNLMQCPIYIALGVLAEGMVRLCKLTTQDLGLLDYMLCHQIFDTPIKDLVDFGIWMAHYHGRDLDMDWNGN